MKPIALALLLISVVSCGEDDDGGSRRDQEETNGKNLFSKWVRSDNRFFLDFTGGGLDEVRSILLSTGTGEICTCSMQVRGSQRSGSLDIFACSSPDCDALWENGRRPIYERSIAS